MTKKHIHFQLPIPVYEALFRVFPQKGEMTLFFKTMAQMAIDLGPESTIFERIREQCSGEKLGCDSDYQTYLAENNERRTRG